MLADSSRWACACGGCCRSRRQVQAIEYIPWTLVITAVIYALASIPTFLFLRERAVPRASVAGG